MTSRKPSHRAPSVSGDVVPWGQRFRRSNFVAAHQRPMRASERVRHAMPVEKMLSRGFCARTRSHAAYRSRCCVRSATAFTIIIPRYIKKIAPQRTKDILLQLVRVRVLLFTVFSGLSSPLHRRRLLVVSALYRLISLSAQFIQNYIAGVDDSWAGAAGDTKK